MDNDKAWNKILSRIKHQLTTSNFRAWFGQTKLGDLTDEKVVIKVPSAFIKGQLLLRYGTLIKQVTEEVLGKDIDLDCQIDASLASKNIPDEEPFEFGAPLPQTTNNSSLNPKYTIESFVVGLTNNLAYAAAQAVVQTPGSTYNPLFIYGPSGVGKTHLMQAIGNALLKKNPYSKVVFVPSEKFMNDFVTSIQTKKMVDFRNKYRNCDALLIDDIQFISGKDSTQEEFFHTYNELHGRNAQLAFTSDRPPHEIQKLESRLQSRFQGGLMVDMQLPDFDTRVAILKAKLAEKGGGLPDEVIRRIAEGSQTSIRELEGKLTQLLQIQKLKGGIGQNEMEQYLGRPQTAPLRLDHKKVLSEINSYFNVKMVDLIGPRRQKELVIPRQIAMYLLHEECGIPMERIGEILGGRDHTTVLHGIDKIRQSLLRDREVQRFLIEVRQLIH